MRLNHLSSAAVLAVVALATAGCPVVVVPGTDTPANVAANGANRAPIIAAFDHSPKSAVGKNDTITFTVVANDLEGDPLQFNWASTKGTLTANTGQVVGWKPTKADGSFEPGLTTVTVIVTDGRQTTTGSVNIQIDAEGKATVAETVLPSPAPTTAATAAPVASPSPVDDGKMPGKILFEDGFETGLGQWKVGTQYLDAEGSNRWNPLGWKTLMSGAQAGKFAAVLNNADNTVKADTEQPNIWIFSKQTIDLTSAVLPRVRLYLKSGAAPASSVNFKVFWGVPTTSGIRDQIFVGGTQNINSSAGWVRKDIDLSTVKDKEGNIGVMLEVNRPTNDSEGPMVDSVTVYDAAQ
ncbi:hypothetical protein D3C72_869960 [compost metagenome]